MLKAKYSKLQDVTFISNLFTSIRMLLLSHSNSIELNLRIKSSWVHFLQDKKQLKVNKIKDTLSLLKRVSFADAQSVYLPIKIFRNVIYLWLVFCCIHKRHSERMVSPKLFRPFKRAFKCLHSILSLSFVCYSTVICLLYSVCLALF